MGSFRPAIASLFAGRGLQGKVDDYSILVGDGSCVSFASGGRESMTGEATGARLQFVPTSRGFFVKLWALVRPYWFSEDRWPGRGLLALVVALNLGTVLMSVLLAQWNQDFFNALQERNYDEFSRQLLRFGGLATGYIIIAVFELYFTQMLQIRWRRWLTAEYYRDWLAERSFYLLQLAKTRIENPEQRIQDDIGMVVGLTRISHGRQVHRGR
jgi:ABC-type uncharacterized transport system fused permease/ATPase subunit